jgi:hypothetical protein
MDDCFCFQWSHRLHGFKNWATDYSDLRNEPQITRIKGIRSPDWHGSKE